MVDYNETMRRIKFCQLGLLGLRWIRSWIGSSNLGGGRCPHPKHTTSPQKLFQKNAKKWYPTHLQALFWGALGLHVGVTTKNIYELPFQSWVSSQTKQPLSLLRSLQLLFKEVPFLQLVQWKMGLNDTIDSLPFITPQPFIFHLNYDL